MAKKKEKKKKLSDEEREHKRWSLSRKWLYSDGKNNEEKIKNALDEYDNYIFQK